MSPSEVGTSRVKLRFDREAALWAILVFIIEVLIATVWSHHLWVRGFVGDVLAVGCLVELGQYVASANDWHVQNRVLKILLGSVPDWMDVLAYACGFLLVLAFEFLRGRLQTRRR